MNNVTKLLVASACACPYIAGAETKQVLYTKDDNGMCYEVVAIEREGVYEIDKQELDCKELLSTSEPDNASNDSTGILDQTTYDDLF